MLYYKGDGKKREFLVSTCMEHTEHENPQKGGGEKEFIAIYDTFADPVFRYIFLRVKNSIHRLPKIK